MKKMLQRTSLCFLITFGALLMNGCLKDTGAVHYKLYTPIYTTTAELRASIKNDMPQPIVNAGKMCILGNTIYLVEIEKGIHIIDNSNPYSPVNKAFISIPGNEDVALEGNILYADCYMDLMAIDVSNPNNIVLKNFVPNLFPDRRTVNGFYLPDPSRVPIDWTVKDTLVNIHLAEGEGIWTGGSYLTGGLLYSSWIFSASSYASSASVSTTGTVGSMSRIAIVNDHLYAVSQDLLNSLSIKDPSNPSYLTRNNLHLGIGEAETIYPFNDKLFIGSTSGMYIFSIANPDKPEKLSTFTHAKVCDPVITDGVNAYITLHSGTNCGGIENEMQIVNVQDVTHPSFIKKYLLSSPRGLSKDGNTLFVCDAIDGLKIYDVSDVNNLILKQTIPVADAYDVICLNKIIYLSSKTGLSQFDYSNLSNIKQLSLMSLHQL